MKASIHGTLMGTPAHAGGISSKLSISGERTMTDHDPMKTPETDEEVEQKLSRRRALAKLGLLASAAYMAPALLALSEAKAAKKKAAKKKAAKRKAPKKKAAKKKAAKR